MQGTRQWVTWSRKAVDQGQQVALVARVEAIVGSSDTSTAKTCDDVQSQEKDNHLDMGGETRFDSPNQGHLAH